jgi:hypothetical protein
MEEIFHLNNFLGLLDRKAVFRYSGDQVCPSMLNRAHLKGPPSRRLTQVQWTKVHGPSNLGFPPQWTHPFIIRILVTRGIVRVYPVVH